MISQYDYTVNAIGQLDGVGGLLSQTEVEGGSTVYYPTYDGNGNVSEYLNSSGSISAHYEYDPLGSLLSSSTDTLLEAKYKFSTKPEDEATGLYYYGYRYYDPVTGRWPSRDPIGELGGINLYGMLANDTVNYWDVLGLAGPTEYHPVNINGIEYTVAVRDGRIVGMGAPLTGEQPAKVGDDDDDGGGSPEVVIPPNSKGGFEFLPDRSLCFLFKPGIQITTSFGKAKFSILLRRLCIDDKGIITEIDIAPTPFKDKVEDAIGKELNKSGVGADIQDALGGILDLLGDVTVIKIIEDEEKCEELLENSP